MEQGQNYIVTNILLIATIKARSCVPTRLMTASTFLPPASIPLFHSSLAPESVAEKEISSF